MRRLLFAAASLALLVPVPTVARTSARSGRSAQVGAYYFDGWAGPLTSIHFAGLIGTQYSRRRPLSGWRDDSPESIEAQLRWAHADGIGFFIFDWYYKPGQAPAYGPFNMAQETYLKLHDHDGVGFALLYVNQGGPIPPEAWPAVAESWVTQDFLNPDYVRVDGKPLLVIFDTTGFRQQMGGSPADVNRAIDTLQQAARRHGLPGVFVVGGRDQSPGDIPCFPVCGATDGGPTGLLTEHYDALSVYGYSQMLEPQDGPRPYTDFTAAEERYWDDVATRGPFPYIPTIMVGWDPRPVAEALGPDPTTGYPWISGHLFWTRGSPGQITSFLRDGIDWANAHPDRRVQSQDQPPIVLIQAWNELGEGATIVPTDEDGYSYGRAVANAVGIPWTAPPKHTLKVISSSRGTVKSAPTGIDCPPTCTARFFEGVQVTLTARKRGFLVDGWTGCTDTDPTCSVVLVRDSTVRPVFLATRQRRRLSLRLRGHLVGTGRLSVIDGFSGCVWGEQVQVQWREGNRWVSVASTQTDDGGRYSMKLPDRGGSYRARALQSSFQGHTCLSAASGTVKRPA